MILFWFFFHWTLNWTLNWVLCFVLVICKKWSENVWLIKKKSIFFYYYCKHLINKIIIIITIDDFWLWNLCFGLLFQFFSGHDINNDKFGFLSFFFCCCLFFITFAVDFVWDLFWNAKHKWNEMILFNKTNKMNK